MYSYQKIEWSSHVGNFQPLPSILSIDTTTLRLIGPLNHVLPLYLSLKDLTRLPAEILIIPVTNFCFTAAGLRAEEKDWISSTVESISIFDVFFEYSIIRNHRGVQKQTWPG